MKLNNGLKECLLQAHHVEVMGMQEKLQVCGFVAHAINVESAHCEVGLLNLCSGWGGNRVRLWGLGQSPNSEGGVILEVPFPAG